MKGSNKWIVGLLLFSTISISVISDDRSSRHRFNANGRRDIANKRKYTRLAIGDTCEHKNECVSTRCSDGKCVGRTNGEFCQKPESCASNHCHLSRCADQPLDPRERTPGPGPWPQTGVRGCGFTGLPLTGILDECNEPLHPDAPDLRGYWKKVSNGMIKEKIEMCGSRWIDISKSVIHDFLACTGTDEFDLSSGCEDYSGPAIIRNNNLCQPIRAACKFEEDESGNKCVNLYNSDVPRPVVSRCLQPDGNMLWIHPVAGKVLYTKVPSDEEPNCMKCGGENNDVTAYNSDDELPCHYNQRRKVEVEIMMLLHTI